MKKSIFFVLVIVIAAFVMVLGLTACTEPNTDPTTIKQPITTIPALTDYSTNASYYEGTPVTYGGSVKTNNETLLATKIASEKQNTGYNGTTFTWNDDVSTVKKIFTHATGDKILERFAKAGLPEVKMTQLVAYIVRTSDPYPTGKEYELIIGQGDLLTDYEELEKLNDIYDEDEDAKIVVDGVSKFVNEVLRLKQYKMMGEIAKIFGGDGDQVARTASEMVAYAQSVVVGTMIDAYKEASAPSYVYTGQLDLTTFMKEILFDYDTLVYFLSYNKTTSLNDDFQPTDKKAIIKLYGYYYLYELGDYRFWSETYKREDYVEYLALSMKEYFDTVEEAQKYTRYDRDHYEKAYRYDAAFYETYYRAHFTFQEDMETFERAVDVYNIPVAIQSLTPGDGGQTYSSQMVQAIGNNRLVANLLMSDINWEYTGVATNVASYQQRSKDYYSLSEALRNLIEDDNPGGRLNFADDIKYVMLQVERLKTQYYTLTHHKVTTDKDVLSNVLLYQIYTYNADTIRGIQSLRKENVIATAEIAREEKKGANKDTALIAERTDTIGRNTIIIENMSSNFSAANTKSQIEKAPRTNWEELTKEVRTVISEDYKAYHEQTMTNGRPRYENTNETQVKTYFEDTLIKRVWVKDNNYEGVFNENSEKSETNGWVKEYDTTWNISRLLNEHDTVLRHANGSVEITYYAAKSNVYNEYKMTATGVAEYRRRTDYSIITSDNYVTWSFASLENGTGTFCANLDKKPTKDKYTSIYKTESLESGDVPAIAVWNGEWKANAQSNKLTPYLITNITATIDGKVYYFEFAGWFMDIEFKYIVRPGDSYDCDMRFYPAFFVTKVN
ncbi:MAG: hypothetical protein LBE09_02735 [Christensenellaceae bacterium]|jgi:hypothetical protein|nr:hypothetical protein [Christensenellaceae bacterium]